MVVPWSELGSSPEFVVLVPFLWLLWQLYLPRLVPNYSTWWTNTRDSFVQEVGKVEQRVESIGDDVADIRETQEKHLNVTVAQSHLLDGHEGSMDVDRVEDKLLDSNDDTPRDYLKDEDEE